MHVNLREMLVDFIHHEDTKNTKFYFFSSCLRGENFK